MEKKIEKMHQRDAPKALNYIRKTNGQENYKGRKGGGKKGVTAAKPNLGTRRAP